MSATKYIARVTQMTVLPEGKPTYAETPTTISIEDTAGGEFVEIKQYEQAVCIAPEEWPAIRKVVDELMKQCKDLEGKK